MRAGKLNQRCALYRAERANDALNGEQTRWVEVRKFWGEIRAVSGRTWLSASQEQSEITVEIYSRPLAVLAGMRVTYGSDTFEVVAPLLSRSLNQLQMMCKTVKAHG
ncbi:SPP1 family predicted phage head-tail adaptor [Pseudomonas sp. JUb42]|uniref:phage head closure protein n=1 Tax=Pseudomonas sp. JUb42 TaxID=2940611 RepID=UPI0021682E59|nr:phage head closure protein [Pseudomonas sp. JUb42]MCS3467399.1 SPP1 family predicted phage head-tail adaptor [Pseudomonas sp. JUb42]